jgi:hypothetical protein
MLPPWRLIWAAGLGIILGNWGWRGLRTDRSPSFLYFCIFVSGMILWGWSVHGWLNWKLAQIAQRSTFL